MLNKKIAKKLVLAQVASDGGKGIEDLEFFDSYVWERGYSVKDRYILDAIQLICTKKDSGAYFYVTRDEHIGSYLVYFNVSLFDGRYQISFHSFNDVLERYCRTKKCAINWDRKESRETARRLITYIENGY